MHACIIEFYHCNMLDEHETEWCSFVMLNVYSDGAHRATIYLGIYLCEIKPPSYCMLEPLCHP